MHGSLLPPPDWSSVIPAAELVNKHIRAGIDKWLTSGPGRAYEFVISSDDAYGVQVVAELLLLGYSATGRRDSHQCECEEHNGAQIENNYYTVQVIRKKED